MRRGRIPQKRSIEQKMKDHSARSANVVGRLSAPSLSSAKNANSVAAEKDVIEAHRRSFRSGQIVLKERKTSVGADKQLEEKWEGEEKKQGAPWALIIFVLLLFVGVVGYITLKQKASPVWTGERVSSSGVQKSNALDEVIILESEMFPEEELKKLREFNAAALETLKEFLATKTAEEMEGYIRHRERVSPLMKEYYKNREITHFEMPSILKSQLVAVDEEEFWIAPLLSSDGRSVGIVFEDTEDGIKVDWETYVNYQDQDWENLLKERPEGEYIVRGYVQPAAFHVYEYTDDKVWACASISILGSDETVYGYFKWESDFTEELVKTPTWRQGGLTAVELRIAFSQKTKAKRSAQILNVEKFFWVKTTAQANALQ